MLISCPSQISKSQVMTRVSKSEKDIEDYYKRGKSMKKGDLYFLDKYTCILIIMHYTLIFDRLVFYRQISFQPRSPK
jgi:hypothetical protein